MEVRDRITYKDHDGDAIMVKGSSLRVDWAAELHGEEGFLGLYISVEQCRELAAHLVFLADAFDARDKKCKECGQTVEKVKCED